MATEYDRFTLKAGPGGWYEILDGETVVGKEQGKEKAQAELDRLAALAATESDADAPGDNSPTPDAGDGTGAVSASQAAAEKAAAEKAAAEKAAATGDEPETVEFEMARRGGTRGKRSGLAYVWDEGDVVRAPEGEFAHLSPGDYVTRPLRPAGQ